MISYHFGITIVFHDGRVDAYKKTASEYLLEGVVSKVPLFVTNVIVANNRIAYLCRYKINFGIGLLFNHESGLVFNFNCRFALLTLN